MLFSSHIEVGSAVSLVNAQRSMMIRLTSPLCTFALLLVMVLGVTGCGTGTAPDTTPPTTTPPTPTPPTPSTPSLLVSGKVLAGVQPVSGASVQVYASGTAGNGAGATAL